jgi:hypothetical protein
MEETGATTASFAPCSFCSRTIPCRAASNPSSWLPSVPIRLLCSEHPLIAGQSICPYEMQAACIEQDGCSNRHVPTFSPSSDAKSLSSPIGSNSPSLICVLHSPCALDTCRDCMGRRLGRRYRSCWLLESRLASQRELFSVGWTNLNSKEVFQRAPPCRVALWAFPAVDASTSQVAVRVQTPRGQRATVRQLVAVPSGTRDALSTDHCGRHFRSGSRRCRNDVLAAVAAAVIVFIVSGFIPRVRFWLWVRDPRNRAAITRGVAVEVPAVSGDCVHCPRVGAEIACSSNRRVRNVRRLETTKARDAERFLGAASAPGWDSVYLRCHNQCSASVR